MEPKSEPERILLYEDINELEAYPVVKRYRDKLGRESTWNRYRYSLRDVLRFLDTNPNYEGLTPDEIYRRVKVMTHDERYEIVDILLEYKSSLEDQGLREKTIKTRISIARSFFKKLRAELPADTDLWAVSPNTPPTIAMLRPVDIKEMILSMNLTYQAVFTCMYQSGMDLDCFDRWNREGWSELKVSLDHGDNIHEIAVAGRKKSRNRTIFYTYIGLDSMNKLRAYASKRPAGGDAIFYNQFGDPITKQSIYLMWHRHLQQLGKIVKNGGDKQNRYGYNPHELRDVFVSQFQIAGIESAGQYFTGHSLDENEYAKAMERRDVRISLYRQGEPYISLFSDSTSLGLVKAEDYEKTIKTQGDTIAILKQEMIKMGQMLEEQQNKLLDTFYMMSSLSPEQQKTMIENLRKANAGEFEDE